MCDIFDYGIKDDTLVLLYNANKEVETAGRTPYGLTKKTKLKNILMQGDVWSSIIASTQVDSITRKVESQGFGYFYKGILPIGALGQVDDTIGISEAGHKAISMHTFINQKTAEKGL